MNIKAKKNSDGTVSAGLDGEPQKPDIPHGYRELLSEEEAVIGDLVYSAIFEEWQDIDDFALQVTYSVRGHAKAKGFLFPPVRKI